MQQNDDESTVSDEWRYIALIIDSLLSGILPRVSSWVPEKNKTFSYGHQIDIKESFDACLDPILALRLLLCRCRREHLLLLVYKWVSAKILRFLSLPITSVYL